MGPELGSSPWSLGAWVQSPGPDFCSNTPRSLALRALLQRAPTLTISQILLRLRQFLVGKLKMDVRGHLLTLQPTMPRGPQTITTLWPRQWGQRNQRGPKLGSKVRLGHSEVWKPQKVDGCSRINCPRNWYMSHVPFQSRVQPKKTAPWCWKTLTHSYFEQSKLTTFGAPVMSFVTWAKNSIRWS